MARNEGSTNMGERRSTGHWRQHDRKAIPQRYLHSYSAAIDAQVTSNPASLLQCQFLRNTRESCRRILSNRKLLLLDFRDVRIRAKSSEDADGSLLLL